MFDVLTFQAHDEDDTPVTLYAIHVDIHPEVELPRCIGYFILCPQDSEVIKHIKQHDGEQYIGNTLKYNYTTLLKVFDINETKELLSVDNKCLCLPVFENKEIAEQLAKALYDYQQQHKDGDKNE